MKSSHISNQQRQRLYHQFKAGRLSRREFMGAATASAATALAVTPGRAISAEKKKKPLNIACIGTGTQGIRVMLGLLKNDDLNITEDEMYLFPENCKQADGWFEKRLDGI